MLRQAKVWANNTKGRIWGLGSFNKEADLTPILVRQGNKTMISVQNSFSMSAVRSCIQLCIVSNQCDCIVHCQIERVILL